MSTADRQQARRDRAAMQAARSEEERAQIAAAISARTQGNTSAHGRQVMAQAQNSSVQAHINGVPLDELAAPLRAKHEEQADALRPFSDLPTTLRAIEILRANEKNWAPERLQSGWARVRGYVETHPEEIAEYKKQKAVEEAEAAAAQQGEAPMQDLTVSFGPLKFNPFTVGKDLFSAAVAVGNSSVTEPIVGVRGGIIGGIEDVLENFIPGGEEVTNDSLNKTMNEWRDALTLAPISEGGNEILQTVAEPVTKLDEGAREVALYMGLGNEWAATGIYTALMGASDVLGIRGGRVLRNSAKLEEAAELAKSLGVRPITQTMPSDIIGAARNMTPPVRAANMGALQTALKTAHETAQKGLEVLRRRVRTQPAYLNTNDARKFASEFTERAVEDGWDLEMMPTVKRRLEEIQGLQGRVIGQEGAAAATAAGVPSGPARLGQSPSQQSLPGMGGPRALPGGQTFIPGEKPRAANTGAAAEGPSTQAVQQEVTHLREWITVRNRIEKDIMSGRTRRDLPMTTNEKALLRRLMTTMDNALEQQFNTDMISGDPTSLAAWKQYDEARQAYVRNFTADRTLAKLIDLEASPEQIKRWIIGANGVNAIPAMKSTVSRLVEVLGPEHPAIKGIQQDYLYDVMAPLLKDQMDLQRFIDNVDNVTRNQKHVTDALGLDIKPLLALRNLAKISQKYPPSKVVKLINNLGYTISRMMPWAHSIAKAGLKVSFMGRLFNKMIGKRPEQQRKILAELAQAMDPDGGPVIDKKSVIAGHIIEKAFYADIQRLAEQYREEDEKLERQK